MLQEIYDLHSFNVFCLKLSLLVVFTVLDASAIYSENVCYFALVFIGTLVGLPKHCYQRKWIATAIPGLSEGEIRILLNIIPYMFVVLFLLHKLYFDHFTLHVYWNISWYKSGRLECGLVAEYCYIKNMWICQTGGEVWWSHIEGNWATDGVV